MASLCLEQPLVSEENLHLPAQEKLPGTGRNLVAVARAVHEGRLAPWGAGKGSTIGIQGIALVEKDRGDALDAG